MPGIFEGVRTAVEDIGYAVKSDIRNGYKKGFIKSAIATIFFSTISLLGIYLAIASTAAIVKASLFTITILPIAVTTICISDMARLLNAYLDVEKGMKAVSNAWNDSVY